MLRERTTMYFNTDPKARPVSSSLPLFQTLLCVACVLILIINSISLVRNLDELKVANGRQAQADRVSGKLQYLNLLVTDAESGMRGYFLSGSETYLGPLRTAQRELGGHFDSLKTLLADNASQLKNLQQLQNLVTRRVHLMTEGSKYTATAACRTSSPSPAPRKTGRGWTRSGCRWSS